MEKKTPRAVLLIEKKFKELLAAKDVTKIEYKETFTYLVPEAIMAEMLLLENSCRGIALEQGKERSPFWYLGKILNPKEAAYKHKHYTKHKYRTITGEEKVLIALPKEFALWKNKERKYLEEHLLEFDYIEDEAAKKRRELEEDIELKEAITKDLAAHFNDYHIIVTRFEDELHYPTLYFTLVGGSTKNEHLRGGVANILWYEEDFERSLTRSDAKIQKYTKDHERVCGTIYFKKLPKD